jgi:hypothetical protein
MPTEDGTIDGTETEYVRGRVVSGLCRASCIWPSFPRQLSPAFQSGAPPFGLSGIRSSGESSGFGSRENSYRSCMSSSFYCQSGSANRSRWHRIITSAHHSSPIPFYSPFPRSRPFPCGRKQELDSRHQRLRAALRRRLMRHDSSRRAGFGELSRLGLLARGIGNEESSGVSLVQMRRS